MDQTALSWRNGIADHKRRFGNRIRHPGIFGVESEAKYPDTKKQRELVNITPTSSLHGLPAGVWLVALVTAWVLFGLVGHDPWKPDEAHYFGVVLDFLRHGDLVVPTLAGEPFVEKPPLFYIVAGLFATMGGAALPLHDAARLATGFFVGIALLFLALTGRDFYGPGHGTAAVLVMIGCLGTIARLHQLITDVALLAGISIGMFGLAVARRSAVGGGIALGIGAACAFLSKGLLGPGWLALTALLLPVFQAWRTRTYWTALVIALFVAFIPSMIWMIALYARSPALFFEWLINNNFGRFFGFARLGTRNPTGFYAQTLLWYALPALPLAIYAVWIIQRDREAPTSLPGVQLSGMLIAVMAAVLALASDSRDLYLMPMMLPLSLLGARGVARMPGSGTWLLSTFARFGLGGLALLLWLGWLALVTGMPSEVQTLLLAQQPGFEPRILWTRLTLAIVATLVASAAMIRRTRVAGFALTQWAVAATLCWALIATLWTPYLNAGKSYRTMIYSLARELPPTDCVASLHLGEPQRALLAYYAGIRTMRLEVDQDVNCPAMLVQDFRDSGAPAPSAEWTLVWEGARPGDTRELYRLYRRDVMGSHPVLRFPN